MTDARIRLAVVGDVMLGRLVNDFLAARPPQWFWGSALPLLQGADAVLANLECAVTRHQAPWARTEKVFHLRADPAAVEVLRAGNVRFVSLANNHVLDFETAGLRDTLDHLDRSTRPSGPSAWKRSTHFLTVFALTPSSAATALGAWPSTSTRRTSPARPRGVKQAFLWTSIRLLLGSPKL
ncbi:MAG: hypothetical protein Kow00114_06470 [Kiloniellaceae bacterium]